MRPAFGHRCAALALRARHRVLRVRAAPLGSIACGLDGRARADSASDERTVAADRAVGAARGARPSLPRRCVRRRRAARPGRRRQDPPRRGGAAARRAGGPARRAGGRSPGDAADPARRARPPAARRPDPRTSASATTSARRSSTPPGPSCGGWPATTGWSLLVDDLDLLDDTSVAVLVPLDRVAHRVPRRHRAHRAHPVAAAEPASSATATSSAWTSSRSRPTSSARCCTGPSTVRSRRHALAELARLSGGNLQVLTELVRGARERGVLVDAGGVWDLTAPLPTTAALDELVAEHLAGVDAGRARGARAARGVRAVRPRRPRARLRRGDARGAGGQPASSTS